jgi:polyvinyl alcohol dehydrogenase (cytochrome)
VVEDVLVIGLGGRGTQQAGMGLLEADLQAFRGAVVGLSASTGEPLWRFEVTRGPDGTEYGAGITVWSSASIDEELGLAFIGTGNSYFPPASPYSDSLLALDYATGELRWSKQFTADDNFRSGVPDSGPDSDVGAAPNLFVAGDRNLVGVGDKSGRYHVLDRATGESVWSVTLTAGSATGGVMAPAAVAAGRVYVCSNESVTQSVCFALDAADGHELWRKDLAVMTFGAPALAGGVLMVGPANGDVYALDAETGAELWKSTVGMPRGGGFSVSNGRVFTGAGYHFFNDASEPTVGAMVAFSVELP